jgi:nicotinate-nucleotide adenylyltransferase
LPPRRIGLLGGSFNPAHPGHRHVSLEALKRLALDEVWWLVSPQNPLKPARGMASFEKRFANAAAYAHHPRIRVVGLEEKLGTRFTLDTLKALQPRFPHQHFVWLMGADNLTQLRRWKDWPQIFRRVPIAVFARPTYCQQALAEMAALRFHRYRIAADRSRGLAAMAPPAWVFFRSKLDASSATAIRSRRAPPARARR